MSSLFETNVTRAGKLGTKKGAMRSATEHKPVCQPRSAQAVGLSMLPLEPCWGNGWSGDTRSVGLSGLFKGRGVIGLLRLPDGVENARPDIGQGSHRDGMALAFSPLALVILLGPGDLLRTLPGKLRHRIAPGLDAAQPSMGFLVRPALEEDWRGARKGLKAAGALVARAVITHFGEHARRETGARSWQSLEELVVLMHQKKAFDLLVVVSNLLHQGFQLVEQRHHQPRFGASRHHVRLQARLLELCSHLLGGQLRSGIPGLFQQGRQIFHRGRASCLQGGIGPQKFQCRGLLQFAEQFQRDGVVGYASSRELVDQAGLCPHQCILVARQGFDLLDLFAIRVEPTQIRKVGASRFRQQIRVNRVRLGSRRRSPSLNGSRVDRIDRPAGFQQMGDQQPVGGLNDAGDLLTVLRTSHPLQVGIQLAQPRRAMGDTDRSQLMTLIVNRERIMIG
jgi:hypothetical protein